MKHFLITGCSTGIGAACALDLATRGHRVFAGVRRDVDGERLQSRLSASGSSNAADRIVPVLLDVAVPASIAAAFEQVQRQLRSFQAAGLDGLVNNAGILVPGPLELLGTDELRRQFEVNVFGVHAVTRTFLPSLRPTRGRLVLVGSISGVVTPPFMGAYAASKHALEALADAFRMELRPWRLPVALVQPDSVATPIWDKMVVGTETGAETAAEAILQSGAEKGVPTRVETAVPASSETKLPVATTGPDASVVSVYREQLQRIGAAARWMGQTGMPLERVLKALRHALLAHWPRSRYRVGLRTHLALWAYPRLANRLFDLFMLSAMGLDWRRPTVRKLDSTA